MKLKELVAYWNAPSIGRFTKEKYRICLPLEDAAKVMALSEMFPERTQEQIITELLSSALHELEASLPYVKGSKIIATDDFNDPVYEDVGFSPIFAKLSKKFVAELQATEAATTK